MSPTRGSQLKEGRWDKIPSGNRNLLGVVAENASMKKEKLVSSMALLPYDLIFKIFLLLPAQSLQRLCFVCKAWFHLINSSTFIEGHTRRCETVLIFLRPILKEKQDAFAIEDTSEEDEELPLFRSSQGQKSRSYIHFLELLDGKGKISESSISGFDSILATCNGLILATSKQKGGLVVMNPSTRKLTKLPLGTIGFHDESYGFVFSHKTSEYKVVHLFRDGGYIGCEILSLATRSWWAVDGPSSGLFREFIGNPISVSGVLYWLPGIFGTNYFVSLDMIDEKFSTTLLPVRSTKNDKLVEISGFLSYITHMTMHRMHIWILKRDLSGDNWVKQHSIDLGNYVLLDLEPIFASTSGRKMFFKGCRDSSFYVYDFKSEVMKKVEMEKEFDQHRHCYLPHLNTLASWES